MHYCFITNADENSYWQVDLRELAAIYKVIIFNRMDEVLFSHRIGNFSILIAEVLSEFKECVSHEDMNGIAEKICKNMICKNTNIHV